MELYRRWYQQLIGDNSGQSTVEYVVVLAACMCVVVALAALWQLLGAGVFVDHLLSAATHQVSASLSWAVDVFSY